MHVRFSAKRRFQRQPVSRRVDKIETVSFFLAASTGSFLLWGIVIGGALMLIVCLVVVSIVIWKKIKSVPSETPCSYATADPYLVRERYNQDILEPFGYRSTLAPGHQTNRSDRDLAECTVLKTFRNASVDANGEFQFFRT